MAIRGMRGASAVALIMIVSGVLGGCAMSATPTSGGSSDRAVITPTPSATPTAIAEPSPVAESHEQVAWKACADVAHTEYVSKHPGSSVEPFSATRDTFQDFGDGSPRMLVAVHPPTPVEGSGGIVVICTMSDTGDSPRVVSWTIKDV
jgi:hypothetical protein